MENKFFVEYNINYNNLVKAILDKGLLSKSRNGDTLMLFGKTINFKMTDYLPVLVSRKLYPQSVYGELKAFLNKPKNIADFEKYNCNYWRDFADDNGDIRVDYGNLWLDFNGINQIENAINLINNDCYSRRILVTGWKPDNINNTSLPCCHYSYQFNVTIKDNKKLLDLLWIQRSTDVMLGLPSDVLLACFLLKIIANTTNCIPNYVYMSLGNSHIYKEHIDNANKLLKHFDSIKEHINTIHPKYILNATYKNYSDLVIKDYNIDNIIKFKLIK